jgi:hypothetical protein
MDQSRHHAPENGGDVMENAIVVGALAALAVASEWWLRRHHARGRLTH